MKKMLVVYYSWSNGNTRRIAQALAEKTGAQLAAIDTVKAYTGSYDDVVAQGQREVQQGYMPAVRDIGFAIRDFDVIAVGTPTRWYTMAPAVHTFLHSKDWNGKTVIPFMTNGGWPGHVIKDMKKECVGAEIALPMEIRFDSNGGDHMETPQKDVNRWISEVKNMLD